MNLPWSRRDFLQMMGCSSLSGMGSRLAWLTGSSARPSEPRFAYVGHMDEGREHGIQVFAVERRGWRRVQDIASERPVFLALHPGEQFLYAVNEIDSYRHLPSGSVEAFAIDPASGYLSRLNRQPLSLSATSPRHMAISPDGSAVVVASHGGGAYNVLPIAGNGELGRVSAIVKETGSSVKERHQEAAHPQMVLFDTTGQRLLGADLGSDRLSVFSLAGDQVAVNHRSSLRAGSGPRSLALHPEGRLLFVANGLEASVSCYEYDSSTGRIGSQLGHVATAGGEAKESGVVMAMHPSGQFLYTANRDPKAASSADGVMVWRTSASGALTPVQSAEEGLHGIHAMAMAKDGNSLMLVSRERGSVVQLQLDPVSGRVKDTVPVAKISAPVSVAMKFI